MIFYKDKKRGCFKIRNGLKKIILYIIAPTGKSVGSEKVAKIEPTDSPVGLPKKKRMPRLLLRHPLFIIIMKRLFSFHRVAGADHSAAETDPVGGRIFIEEAAGAGAEKIGAVFPGATFHNP